MTLRSLLRFNNRQILTLLFVLAFVLRVGVRLVFGEELFWTNSYSLYYDLAENVTSGKGFCLDTTCAFWPPLYPLFLAITAIGGKHYLLIVVPQAIIGASTSLCAFLIGRSLFGATVGTVACALVAVYPYYVMHDTALQETGMVTFLVALCVFLLLRAGQLNRKGDWFFAGVGLGLIALTRASVAPIAGVGLVWTAVWGTSTGMRRRLINTSIVFLGILLLLGPWLVRTYRLVGAPVLSSQTGYALWLGNNAQTFSAYPDQSIDISAVNAWQAIPGREQAEVAALSNEIDQSNWYERRAMRYITSDPWRTVTGAFHKVTAAFSWRLNPNRERLAQVVYAISYVPIALLGVVGMFQSWRRREVVLIILIFLAFTCVTAVFWSHTSHRTYLDVYLIVFAALVVEKCKRRIELGSRRNRRAQIESSGMLR